MSYYHQAACVFFMLTATGLVVAVFHSNRDVARLSAVLSILGVMAADYLLLSDVPNEQARPWFDISAPKKVKKQVAAQAIDEDGEVSEAAGGGSSGGGGTGSSAGGRGSASEAGGRGSASGSAGARAMAANMNSKPDEGGGFRDCPECPRMVYVREGSTKIGASDIEKAEEAERPARDLRVLSGFAMSHQEISRAELERAGLKPRSSGACAKAAGGDGDSAVTCVAQSEIGSYLRWLNDKSGQRYRLPTAAEWEFAARTSAG